MIFDCHNGRGGDWFFAEVFRITQKYALFSTEGFGGIGCGNHKGILSMEIERALMASIREKRRNFAPKAGSTLKGKSSLG